MNPLLKMFATMIEIFRAGVHKGRTYTEDEVREIAETYDRTRHEAPFLVNHDESKPNQGLVKAVIALGDRLFAIPHKVVTEFAEAVNSGRSPKISVRLYHPEDSANPVKGKWGLRHVAAVQIPAVKGMESPTFSESEDSLEYCFSEPTEAKFIAFPEDESIVFAEREAALNQREQSLVNREASIVTREAELTKLEFSEYCDKLIGDGKVLPHEKPKIVATLVKLAKSEDVIEFSEGGEDKSERLLDTYKATLEARIKQVDFAEIPKGVDPVNSADPQAQAKAIAKVYAQAEKEGNPITFAEAQNIVLGLT